MFRLINDECDCPVDDAGNSCDPCKCFHCSCITPWLTGAGARSAEGTDIGHENAEGMAYVGVRVEPTVRLGTEVEGGSRHESFDWDLRRTA